MHLILKISRNIPCLIFYDQEPANPQISDTLTYFSCLIKPQLSVILWGILFHIPDLRFCMSSWLKDVISDFRLDEWWNGFTALCNYSVIAVLSLSFSYNSLAVKRMLLLGYLLPIIPRGIIRYSTAKFGREIIDIKTSFGTGWGWVSWNNYFPISTHSWWKF